MPRDLALAEAHSAFAELEFYQADARRAREHLDIALVHVAVAVQGSVACSSEDRDGDGIPDIRDACPTVAEDMDGIADDDGCPEEDVVLAPVLMLQDNDDLLIVAPDAPTATDSDGDGVHNADDECPQALEDIDGFRDGDGCPDPDNDGDGIADVVDKCPMDAEDVDGWEDIDGCPDPDNDMDGFLDVVDPCPDEAGSGDGCPTLDSDGDGVVDEDDRCPTEPETLNGYLDDDGCPDVKPERVEIQYGQIMVTKGKLAFEAGGTRLTLESEVILEEVAQLMYDVPDLTLRIEGHTDNQGEVTILQIKSQNMAETVRDALMESGIQPARMEVIGHGGARPVDTNRTPDGRDSNNRVELHVTSQ
jgi:outer membrane protein OmpA-like peptidoglycan-associated protein